MDVDLLSQQAIILLRRLGEVIAPLAQRLAQGLALDRSVLCGKRRVGDGIK